MQDTGGGCVNEGMRGHNDIQAICNGIVWYRVPYTRSSGPLGPLGPPRVLRTARTARTTSGGYLATVLYIVQ